MATPVDALLKSGLLRSFITAKRGSWTHDDWQMLLASVRSTGHTTISDDEVGRLLETERTRLQAAMTPNSRYSLFDAVELRSSPSIVVLEKDDGSRISVGRESLLYALSQYGNVLKVVGSTQSGAKVQYRVRFFGPNFPAMEGAIPYETTIEEEHVTTIS